jgi:membrane-associated phospholipid phosphatase
MKKTVVFIIAILFSIVSIAQKTKPDHQKVYKVNLKSEIPITIGLFALNYYGFTLLGEKAPLDSLQIVSLDKNDVWAFDRNALTQDPSKRLEAHDISDWGMNISLLLPALLALDKDIRHDWVDLLVLYLETQAINSTLYAYGGPMLTKRIRPFVYYDEVPYDEKTGTGTTDSFFSGHTSTTAAASFFMAKVYSDYHPELGNKKFLIFGAALIPPAIVGYYRYRALKHFPTDVMTGTLIGAATGILVPHLHKIVKRKNENLSILPYAGKYSGIAVSLKF